MNERLPRCAAGPAAGRSAAVFALAGAGFGVAHAHGFQERYDPPVPSSVVIAGACLIVALTFIAAASFVRGERRREAMTPDHRAPPDVPGAPAPAVRRIPVPLGVLACTRGAAWLLFMVSVVAALYGTQDPLMNLAPTLFWIVGWIGLSVLAALMANVWAALDPWRTTFDVLDRFARRAGRAEGLGGHRPWPAALGVWPATMLLLAWCWVEVVDPIATSPWRLGCAALAWTAVSLGGMATFGPVAWQRHGDVFALTFATLGRIAPLRLAIGDPAPRRWPAGQVGFVIAMLATVAFDGLHGSAAWEGFEHALRHVVPKSIDINDRLVGTVGLVVVWLGFLLAFQLALRMCFSIADMPAAASRRNGPADRVDRVDRIDRGDRVGFVDRSDRADLAARLAIALVPIALAYLVAHNFSSLLGEGPTVLQLFSDPFGRQWDLFGTAHTHLDPGLVTPRSTWLVAVGALVAGHMASIVASHRVVAAAGLSPRRAALAMLPMTVLMLAYTAVSLLLIAQPMVAPAR